MNFSVYFLRIEGASVEYIKKEAEVSDVDILSTFWVRLMEEESPPLSESGPTGFSDCRKSLLNMLPVKDRVHGVILFHGEAPVGFALGYTYERPYGFPKFAGQILHWYVLPEHRGRGEGRKLLNMLIDWMVSRKVQILEVMAKDDPARNAAWESMGFTVTLKIHGKKL